MVTTIEAVPSAENIGIDLASPPSAVARSSRAPAGRGTSTSPSATSRPLGDGDRLCPTVLVANPMPRAIRGTCPNGRVMVRKDY
jgi:hypothetical protein